MDFLPNCGHLKKYRLFCIMLHGQKSACPVNLWLQEVTTSIYQLFFVLILSFFVFQTFVKLLYCKHLKLKMCRCTAGQSQDHSPCRDKKEVPHFHVFALESAVETLLLACPRAAAAAMLLLFLLLHSTSVSRS